MAAQAVEMFEKFGFRYIYDHSKRALLAHMIFKLKNATFVIMEKHSDISWECSKSAM